MLEHLVSLNLDSLSSGCSHVNQRAGPWATGLVVGEYGLDLSFHPQPISGPGPFAAGNPLVMPLMTPMLNPLLNPLPIVQLPQPVAAPVAPLGVYSAPLGPSAAAALADGMLSGLPGPVLPSTAAVAAPSAAALAQAAAALQPALLPHLLPLASVALPPPLARPLLPVVGPSPAMYLAAPSGSDAATGTHVTGVSSMQPTESTSYSVGGSTSTSYSSVTGAGAVGSSTASVPSSSSSSSSLFNAEQGTPAGSSEWRSGEMRSADGLGVSSSSYVGDRRRKSFPGLSSYQQQQQLFHRAQQVSYVPQQQQPLQQVLVAQQLAQLSQQQQQILQQQKILQEQQQVASLAQHIPHLTQEQQQQQALQQQQQVPIAQQLAQLSQQQQQIVQQQQILQQQQIMQQQQQGASLAKHIPHFTQQQLPDMQAAHRTRRASCLDTPFLPTLLQQQQQFDGMCLDPPPPFLPAALLSPEQLLLSPALAAAAAQPPLYPPALLLPPAAALMPPQLVSAAVGGLPQPQLLTQTFSGNQQQLQQLQGSATVLMEPGGYNLPLAAPAAAVPLQGSATAVEGPGDYDYTLAAAAVPGALPMVLPGGAAGTEVWIPAAAGEAAAADVAMSLGIPAGGFSEALHITPVSGGMIPFGGFTGSMGGLSVLCPWLKKLCVTKVGVQSEQ